MLKRISVLQTKVHDKLNDLWRRIRNLYRVGLNVHNGKALLLNLVLKKDHEESSALRDNIINVPRILKRIGERSRR